MDDVLVFGQNYEEHDVTALRRIQAAGATLNKEKCVFRMECAKVLGHIINGDGISADPEKTEAVFKMPAPDNITELRPPCYKLQHQLYACTPQISYNRCTGTHTHFHATVELRELCNEQRHVSVSFYSGSGHWIEIPVTSSMHTRITT